jgi:CheY-like chemotaxis protein
MADDDDDDCTLAKDAFRESGARGAIHCVQDGMKLMDFLARSDPVPALVLLDLNMPIKDGREVLREIKSTPAFRHIPVVVFTTSREKEDIAYSSELGAHSFITKPNTFGEWVGIMRSLADQWLEAGRSGQS